MQQKLISIGNSAGIIIPQSIRTDINIGDMLDIQKENGKIVVSKIKRTTKKQSPITAKFAQMVDSFMTDHKDVLQELANK